MKNSSFNHVLCICIQSINELSPDGFYWNIQNAKAPADT